MLSFAPEGVTVPHIRLMMQMTRQTNGASVKELAAALQVTPSAVTQFIDRLVAKDMVERFEDPDDRRVVRIKVSERAKANLEAMKLEHFRKVSTLFQSLSDQELEQFTKLLTKIVVSPVDKTCFEPGPDEHKQN